MLTDKTRIVLLKTVCIPLLLVIVIINILVSSGGQSAGLGSVARLFLENGLGIEVSEWWLWLAYPAGTFLMALTSIGLLLYYENKSRWAQKLGAVSAERISNGADWFVVGMVVMSLVYVGLAIYVIWFVIFILFDVVPGFSGR